MNQKEIIPPINWNTLRVLHLINREESVQSGQNDEHINWLIDDKKLLERDSEGIIHGIELQEGKDFYDTYQEEYLPKFIEWGKVLITRGIYDLRLTINEEFINSLKQKDRCVAPDLGDLAFWLLHAFPEIDYLEMKSCKDSYARSDFFLMIGWGADEFEEFDLFEERLFLNFNTQTISGNVSQKYISKEWPTILGPMTEIILT